MAAIETEGFSPTTKTPVIVAKPSVARSTESCGQSQLIELLIANPAGYPDLTFDLFLVGIVLIIIT
jgi:hypothetical protein